MPTSCGAKSCLSIFLSCDRGSPTLPIVRAWLAKADPTEAAFKQATPGRGSALHCPENPISFHHAAVSSARPGRQFGALPSASSSALLRRQLRDVGPLAL